MARVDTYQIGELAKRSGLTPDALRYYERLGLLRAPHRTTGGFRVYTGDSLDRVRFIKLAQTLGLSLHEIGMILSYQDKGGSRRCRQVRDLLRLKLVDLQSKLTELHNFQNTLSGYLAECDRAISEGESLDPKGQTCCPMIENLRTEQ